MLIRDADYEVNTFSVNYSIWNVQYEFVFQAMTRDRRRISVVVDVAPEKVSAWILGNSRLMLKPIS